MAEYLPIPNERRWYYSKKKILIVIITGILICIILLACLLWFTVSSGGTKTLSEDEGRVVKDHAFFLQVCFLMWFLNILTIFFLDCQDGWDYFPHTNKCYKHFNYSTIITWMDAQHTCRQFGVSKRICVFT